MKAILFFIKYVLRVIFEFFDAFLDDIYEGSNGGRLMTERREDPATRTHFEPDHHASAAGRYFHHRDRVAKTMGTSVATVDAEQWHPGVVIEMEGVTIIESPPMEGESSKGAYVLLPFPRGRRYLDDGDWIVVSAGEVSVYSDAAFRERFEAV